LKTSPTAPDDRQALTCMSTGSVRASGPVKGSLHVVAARTTSPLFRIGTLSGSTNRGIAPSRATGQRANHSRSACQCSRPEPQSERPCLTGAARDARKPAGPQRARCLRQARVRECWCSTKRRTPCRCRSNCTTPRLPAVSPCSWADGTEHDGPPANGWGRSVVLRGVWRLVDQLRAGQSWWRLMRLPQVSSKTASMPP
jgi:hypothetical protein